MDNTKVTNVKVDGAAPVQDTEKEKRKKEKKVLKNKALETLKTFFEKNPNEECTNALKTLKPSMYGVVTGRTGGTPVYKTIVDKIITAGEAGVKEITLFQDFHIGRKETNNMFKKYLNKVEPKDRVWIEFTPSNGIYKVVGKGPKAPANYTGYVPVEQVTELK